jgi:nicotinate phosphoribosyltransferase
LEDSYIVNPLDSTHIRVIKKNVASVDLLEPIFRDGNRVYEMPSLEKIRQNTQKQLSQFPIGTKRFLNPHIYVVGMEKNLYDLKIKLIQNIRQAIPMHIEQEEKKIQ